MKQIFYTEVAIDAPVAFEDRPLEDDPIVSASAEPPLTITRKVIGVYWGDAIVNVEEVLNNGNERIKYTRTMSKTVVFGYYEEDRLQLIRQFEPTLLRLKP